MCGDQNSLQNTQDFLQAYFQRTFEYWSESYNLPRKMLAKVDERKLPYTSTAMGVIDASFYSALYGMGKNNHRQKVTFDIGMAHFFQDDEVKLSALNAHAQADSLLYGLSNGMQNIHVILQVTKAYNFERSVYGFWLHDIDDCEFNFHFFEDEVLQLSGSLKGFISQKLFFDREANKRWNAAAEHERYTAMGRWAAEQDSQ